MYLATLHNGTCTTFQLRQSYRKEHDESTFGSRLIYDLGHDPGRFFKLYNDHIVFFDEKLLAAVAEAGIPSGEQEIETLLCRFLPKETRRRMALFGNRRSHRPAPLSDQDKREIARQVHLFDRRRLYYLRYGAVDQSRLSRLHEKCCRPLLGQSRDEREYWFAAEEQALSPGMYLQYVYAIFNVQKHFRESFAPWFPEALVHDEVAEHFLSEICNLNGDTRFWQNEELPSALHPHLRRYLIMFFDYRPAAKSYRDDFFKAFMAGHRRFRWPERPPDQSPEKISEIFSVPYEELRKMTGPQLNKLYRKKAMQLHPDRGGDHDLFIELTSVYETLRRLQQPRGREPS